MKILVTNYTINPTLYITPSRQGYIQMTVDPTLQTTPILDIESLLLITKVTTGSASQILYNFASSDGDWIINGDKIYFPWVSSLSPTDELQIYYDWTGLDTILPTLLRSNSDIKSNTDVMKALLTTLNDLTDSMYNVSEKLRILDAVRDIAANIRVIPTGGIISTISQLNSIIGDIPSTSTSAGYLRAGAVTSQHNSAAQNNINLIIP